MTSKPTHASDLHPMALEVTPRVTPLEAGDSRFGTIEQAVADIAAGKAVVVVDGADRENEGDLIFAAEMATPELVAFMVRYTSGYICVPLTDADCTRLDLPPMHHVNQDRRAPPTPSPSMPVRAGDRDLGHGSGTDHAAARRPRRHGRRLQPARPRRPAAGQEGGVLRRPGHTEAAIDLARLAGLRPAGVLCEVVCQKVEAHGPA